MPTREDWAKALLGTAGLPVNNASVNAVIAWQKTEGSRNSYNPLGVGVQANHPNPYPGWMTGIRSSINKGLFASFDGGKTFAHQTAINDLKNSTELTPTEAAKFPLTFLTDLYNPPAPDSPWGEPWRDPGVKEHVTECSRQTEIDKSRSLPAGTGTDTDVLAQLKDVAHGPRQSQPESGSVLDLYDQLSDLADVVEALHDAYNGQETTFGISWAEVEQSYDKAVKSAGDIWVSGSSIADAQTQSGKVNPAKRNAPAATDSETIALQSQVDIGPPQK